MSLRRLGAILALVLLVFAAALYTGRRAVLEAAQPAIVSLFHHVYYNSGVSNEDTKWLGVTVQKTPNDLFVLQEIVSETKPDVLIETGTYRGGSAYFFATLFDQIGHGRILTVDIEDIPGRPLHPRIEYLLGSSTDSRIVARIQASIAPGERVMVLLDSDHHAAHVAAELRLYAPLVTPGCYLVVEDTNLNGNPIWGSFGPGPAEALREFLATTDEFEADRSREKFLLTYNPGGYLRRVR